MKATIIGITPRIAKIDDVTKLQVNYTYLVPFNKRNVLPIILPIDSKLLASALELCDGFLVIGGDDINPTLYGETNTGLSKCVNDSLDSIDQEVIKYAYSHRKPLLGICRGIQSLAVFLGGTLHQDLETCNVRHECENHEHIVDRMLTTPFTSLLPEHFMVNSYHHQAVNIVPNGFQVIFKYQDTIEAIEHETLPIIGVQWHPERYQTPESEIIFDYFIKIVNNNKNLTN